MPIKTILCHVGDDAAIRVLDALACNVITGSIRRQVASRETVKDAKDRTLYSRQVVDLSYAGKEAAVEVELVRLPPDSVSKAEFLERRGLESEEVLYATVMSNHEEWLDLEPVDTVKKPFVLITPQNLYSKISGFPTALVMNDLQGTESARFANAVKMAVRAVSERILGPKPKDADKRRGSQGNEVATT